MEMERDAVGVGVVDTPAQQEQAVTAVSQVLLGVTARYSTVEVGDGLRRSCNRRRSCHAAIDHRQSRADFNLPCGEQFGLRDRGFQPALSGNGSYCV